MERRKTRWHIIAIRAGLTALCIGVIAWIFSNSLRTADESSQQSASVVSIVQNVFAFFNPDSAIATATGALYERLQEVVRVLAHFCEFALLGALLVWCQRAYASESRWLIVPLALVMLVPMVDEILQFFTEGRALQVMDVVIDVAGGVCGGAFALLTVWIVNKIKNKKGKDGAKDGEGQLTSSSN